MKLIVILALMVSSVAFAQAQDSSSPITGKWKVHASIAGNDNDALCTFTQTGNDLSGTCAAAMGSTKITGKRDGKKVTWSYNSEYNGTPLTVKYDGTLDSGKIAGGVTVDPFGATGDFTATAAPDTANEPAAVPRARVHSDGSDSSLVGKWKIHSSIAGNESDATCTFEQTNDDLSGTCPGPDGGVKFTGRMDGKKVKWTYQIQYNGSPLTMKYDGTLDSGKITGNVTVDPMGVSGDFTGTPAS